MSRRNQSFIAASCLGLGLIACKSPPQTTAGAERAHAPAAAAEAQTAQPPGEWQDLLPPADLAGYRRVPIEPLADKSVWQVRPDGILFIDGSGAKEMLLSEREFGDGLLHVEWRFIASQAAPAPVYNGGVYVRTPLDGTNWVQLQIAHADKPPVVGDLIAHLPGHSERVDVFQNTPSAAGAIGEWNSYDISLLGPHIALSVNGQPSADWSACPLPSGHIGLQAEGSPIEVRALRFKGVGGPGSPD